MRHGMSGRKLNRTSSHRKALLMNLANSLLKHEQIKTTLPKAKELKPYVEKIITLGKKGDLASRRRAAQLVRFEKAVELNDDGEVVKEQYALKKLFEELAPKYANRNGGYTRVLKTGPRRGDSAPMAIIAFVEE